LKRILNEHKNVILTIVGSLNMADYPELAEFDHQIEVRPLVSLDKLFQEIYRFDINIAPLELPNPFCEAKSPLRFLFAAAQKIPSVVSPSQPLVEATENGEFGLIAYHETEWYELLKSLICNPGLRRDLGIKAENHTLVHFGPESGSRKTIKIFEDISTWNGKRINNPFHMFIHNIRCRY
jgi:glycosyltransferase involved in cell wall biosynthesis